MGQDDPPKRRRFQTAAYDQKIIPQHVQIITNAPPTDDRITTHATHPFPLINVPPGTHLTKIGEKISSVFVIHVGEAEEIVSPDAETNSGRKYVSGDVIHIDLLREDRQNMTSRVEIIATSALTMYQFSLDDLETNNIALNRQREHYIRKLIFQHADTNAKRSSQAMIQANKRITDLADVLKKRLDEIKIKVLRPLRRENQALQQQIYELEPWVHAMFEWVPMLHDQQALDEKSVDDFVERILIERCLLYDIVRDDLLDMLSACQDIDPKNSAPLNASILRLMAKLDEKFKRNMPQLSKLPL